MTKQHIRHHAVLSKEAEQDIRDLLQTSLSSFGRAAAVRYGSLLTQAIRDLEADPERAGSRSLPGLAEGARGYHLALSRKRSIDRVKTPRHLLIYRVRNNRLEIARVLYDASDVLRHLGPEWLS